MKQLIFLITIILTHTSINAMYEIKILKANDIARYIKYIADMRIQEFRLYPYLYQGSLQYEEEYLREYAVWQNTAVAIAYYANKPVGFLTGTALTDFDGHFKGTIKEFEDQGHDPSSFYYFGEIIIEKEHRGKGLSKKLFEQLEGHAQKLGFTRFCMATVIREENHPLKPNNYESADGIWEHLGYKKSSMIIYYEWPTIQPDGSVKEQSNPLVYWIK